MTRARLAGALSLAALALVGLVAGLYWLDPASRFSSSAPPAEDLSIERVVLHPGEVRLVLRNVGAPDVTVAQVAVDGAYWAFDMTPSTTLSRYQSGEAKLAYDWVAGEPLHVKVLTTSGIAFEHEVPVAVETPTATPAVVRDYAWLGILVGLVPVAAGMLLLPAMRQLSSAWEARILAFTIGVLAFLAIDALNEGLDAARELPNGLHGVGALVASVLFALLAVLALSQRLRARGLFGPLGLAGLLALSIGLHNLGEGLAIGSAFALGSLGLGASLVVGFAVHNVTEGPVVVSPLASGHAPAWWKLLGLAALAGLPTVLGAWVGAFYSTGIWSIVFLGLGAGAVLVVIGQVGSQLRAEGLRVTPAVLLAFGAGFLVMLATSFLAA